MSKRLWPTKEEEQLCDRTGVPVTDSLMGGRGAATFSGRIAALIRLVRAQENEACALIVAPPGHFGERECTDIAAQIRARIK